mgnify:CR=1 FL=1
MVDYGVFLAIGLVGLIIGVKALFSRPKPKFWLHSLYLKITGLRKMVQNIDSARMSRTLSIMVGSGVPILASMRASERVMNNQVLRQDLQLATEEVAQGVSIAAMMPVDVPEEEWENLQIVFATSEGDVRRNKLSDFTNVMRNGKIAMKLPEDVELVNARICTEDDDVMLVTDAGRAIRFRTTDVRVFKGRDSTGVRGIRLSGDATVVSMAVSRHFEATPEGGIASTFVSRVSDSRSWPDSSGSSGLIAVSFSDLGLSPEQPWQRLDYQRVAPNRGSP